MQVSEVRIKNFGPFYNQATIHFGVLPRPVVVVHGENEYGKTSIVNAIRWAFYGIARDRFRNGIPLTKLINNRKKSEGVWEASVEIDFQDSGNSYLLTRTAQARPNARGGEDFPTSLYLRRNAIQLTREDADAEIKRLFPEETSRFFLFDGEQLNEYETLVANPTSQVGQIKTSIENILGVPALTNAVIDLEVRRKETGRRQRARAGAVANAQAIASLASQLAKEVELREADVEALKNRETQLDSQIHKLETALSLEESTAKLIDRYGLLDQQIQNEASERDRLIEERSSLISRAWVDLIQARVAGHIEELEARKEAEDEAAERWAGLVSRRDQLDRAVQVNVCSLCGQPLGREKVVQLGSELAKVSLQLDNLVVNPETRGETAAAIKRLRAVAPVETGGRMRALEDRIDAIRVRTLAAEQERADIRMKLSTADIDAVRERGSRLRALSEEYGQLQGKRNEQEKELNDQRVKLAQLESKLQATDDPELRRLNREIALYEGLISVFTRSIDRLRDALRGTIERDASEVFLRLTANPNYAGLKINENYGLTIMAKNGLEVTVRSAGAEQIVALALIAALNRNATLKGPVVMDTPLARLDLRHRANILKFLPTMADQTTLLVQPGEVERKHGLDSIRHLIDREYLLVSLGLGETEVRSIDYRAEP